MKFNSRNLIQNIVSIFLVNIIAFSGASAASFENRDAANAKRKLVKLVKQCSFLDTDKIVIQKRDSRISASRLIKLLKKEVAKKLPNSGDLWDSEIFINASDLSFGLSNRPATFEGFGNLYSGHLLSDDECISLKRPFEKKFNVYGVKALNKNGVSVSGNILQKRFGKSSYVFMIISKPFNSSPSEAAFESIENLELIKTHVEYSDGEIVERLRKNRKNCELDNIRVEQIKVARQSLIRNDPQVYGGSIYDGNYLDNELTSWKSQEYLVSDSNDLIDVVYFDEYDDGSYSFYFAKDSNRLLHMNYEN